MLDGWPKIRLLTASSYARKLVYMDFRASILYNYTFFAFSCAPVAEYRIHSTVMYIYIYILSEVHSDHETKELTVAAIAVSLYHFAVCQHKVGVYKDCHARFCP